MTAVVGYTDGTRTWVGADSLATDLFNSKSTLTSAKVFRKGRVLIGYSDSFRVGQILKHEFTVPRMVKDADQHTWAVTVFIPALEKLMRSHGLVVDNVMESELILGLPGRLLGVSSDFGVHEYRCGYAAVGSGGDLCLGTMFATEGSDMKPTQRIRKALQAAERFNNSVGAPFSVLSVG